MSKPIIGVTTYRFNNKHGYPHYGISVAYMQALIHAGAHPLAIPLGIPPSDLETLIAHLDGVLFSGGGDIHPQLYKGDNHPKVSEVDDERDRLEIALFQAIWERGKPFLGICRGMQLINVALGGNLYEDILDQHPHAMRHQYAKNHPRDYLAHEVEIQPDTQLREVLGVERIKVNSLHHQGVRQLAGQLRCSAVATDGIIEAFEAQEHPFGLAVQWHPENLQAYAPMRALFQAFVRAAS